MIYAQFSHSEKIAKFIKRISYFYAGKWWNSPTKEMNFALADNPEQKAIKKRDWF
jgi:hypothetical protein